MHHFLKALVSAVALCAVTGLSPAAAVTLNLHNGGDATSLDPQRVSGDWENRIVGDIFEGLVTEDAKARPIPGMARDWTISDDGLTYTFNLKEGIKWSDGEPVKASDFVFAFKRLMDPEQAAQYAYLQYPIKNAEAINTGKMDDLDALGVKAIDDRTVEITLERPTPYYLSALLHYTAYPLPEHVLKEKGDAWVQIGNIVTNGPYRPVEWVPGSHVLTEKNPEWSDPESLDIDGVKFFTLEDQSAALRRYRAGEFDILTGFPTDQYKWLQENRPGEARVEPFAGLYYYVLNTSRPPLDKADVRKALSMAVYREIIGPNVLGTGELPAFSWVPPGIGNYESGPAYVEWKDMAYPQRVEEAKRLLAEAGHGPDNPLKLTLSYNTDDNHKRIAVAVAAMWKPLGVDVELTNAETKVHYANLRQGTFEVGRAGWLADYDDPTNFLDLLKSGIEMNYGRWTNPEYDALLNKAAEMQNLEERAATLVKAETIALEDSAAIPIYYYVSRNVVSPQISGFEDNIKDIHRTRWLAKTE
ncbi:peptide ABC transporter substrate-binding protein [Fulvimarina sp. 2208YS6-2-32]|uniref:Peptide ABC transporter substrate-binding protein n=1 Tax=Fulvimarina uroteuthidis TaxID=3098149 RepID=A0ABU5I2L6_9HYPH|nr:peptide ABC transporter substrate-binding protein [Fulvimarina sp. 2208YS6-2-32]MDY8109218.1 peptide ABC transporter substrate-binding protein [Fulvimarina sp. 2208YS6-2-32]